MEADRKMEINPQTFVTLAMLSRELAFAWLDAESPPNDEVSDWIRRALDRYAEIDRQLKNHPELAGEDDYKAVTRLAHWVRNDAERLRGLAMNYGNAKFRELLEEREGPGKWRESFYDALRNRMDTWEKAVLDLIRFTTPDIYKVLGQMRNDARDANSKLDTIDKTTKQTDRLVGVIASDKQRTAEKHRRALEKGRENGTMPPANPDTQKLFKAIDAELKKQEENGKKRNVSQAVRVVAKRNRITSKGKISSLRVQYVRAHTPKGGKL